MPPKGQERRQRGQERRQHGAKTPTGTGLCRLYPAEMSGQEEVLGILASVRSI